MRGTRIPSVCLVALLIALPAWCEDPDEDAHAWNVAIELGAQGSTFNSTLLSEGEENPSLFENTNEFVGVEGAITGLFNETADLLWGIRFGSVDAEFEPDPSMPGEVGTKLLNDAESLHLKLEFRRFIGEHHHYFFSGRASGYSPTETSADPATRANFLGEYGIFAGVINRQSDRLKNSTLQIGYGLSERFVEDSRVFVEVQVSFEVTKKTSFIVDLGTALGDGSDDLRASFGFRTMLSGIESLSQSEDDGP